MYCNIIVICWQKNRNSSSLVLFLILFHALRVTKRKTDSNGSRLSPIMVAICIWLASPPAKWFRAMRFQQSQKTSPSATQGIL
jgi:hypothetical protein